MGWKYSWRYRNGKIGEGDAMISKGDREEKDGVSSLLSFKTSKNA